MFVSFFVFGLHNTLRNQDNYDIRGGSNGNTI
jgi:hypothetical protein